MHLFGLPNGPLWPSLALSYPLALSCSLALFLSFSDSRWLSITLLLSGSLSLAFSGSLLLLLCWNTLSYTGPRMHLLSSGTCFQQQKGLQGETLQVGL